MSESLACAAERGCTARDSDSGAATRPTHALRRHAHAPAIHAKRTRGRATHTRTHAHAHTYKHTLPHTHAHTATNLFYGQGVYGTFAATADDTVPSQGE